mgnify:FL=1
MIGSAESPVDLPHVLRRRKLALVVVQTSPHLAQDRPVLVDVVEPPERSRCDLSVALDGAHFSSLIVTTTKDDCFMQTL